MDPARLTGAGVRTVGEHEDHSVDVRMIAATHRDLEAMIRNNQFREDLFYRLNVFPIEIPPLRHRREDIQLLVHFFVSRHSRRMQKRIRSIPTLAMDALVSADWPGNIRELENFIERCVILTQGDELNVPRIELKRSDVRTVVAPGSTFEQAEKRAIIDALKSASGKIAGKGGAAERLGLKRITLSAFTFGLRRSCTSLQTKNRFWGLRLAGQAAAPIGPFQPLFAAFLTT